MNLTEKVIATERKYEGRVVNLRVDTVELPNGKQGKREVVEHCGAVAVVPMLSDGTVLMVRQFRLPTGGPLLEVVAGGIDGTEDPETAARRELSEEIGMTCGKLTPLYAAYVAPGYCTEKIYAFLAEDLTPHKETQDEDEFVETVPMPLADVLKAIATGEIEDMKSIAALMCIKRH
jgi:ADP-ribose pyrophosphatase